jgi:hypothetical protein
MELDALKMNMSVKDERLEKAGMLFWEQRADFLVAYCEKDKETDHELKWRLAWTLASKAREDCERLAAKYHAFATYYYKRKRDKIFEEVIDPLNGKLTTIGLGTGKLMRALMGTLEDIETPANAIGQRWWQLVIASGATRNAGYVIVTRVAAKDANEARKYITDIQAIMSNGGVTRAGRV